MRHLRSLALWIVVIVSCEHAVPPPTASPTARPTACAPPIVPGAPLSARLTTLDTPVGSLVVFGLSGAFLGSAFGYPLGAPRHWSLADDQLRPIGQIDWNLASRPLPSPDGSLVAYVATAPDEPGLAVRSVAGGVARVLQPSDRGPYAWLDTDHLLVDPPAEHGILHSIDVRDGTDVVVFTPPAPPTPNSAGPEWDGWSVSGDLRWAILTRLDPQGTVTDEWVYDARDGALVARLAGDWRPAPRGDLAVSFDGGRVRVMHLCDRRIVELAVRSGSAFAVGGVWSLDGRYVAVTFGTPSEAAGPESLVIVEPLAGRVAIVDGPWGFVHAWSPDLRYVALGRRGYHDVATRIARLEIDGR
jgi:hypothetical protein